MSGACTKTDMGAAEVESSTCGMAVPMARAKRAKRPRRKVKAFMLNML